MTIENKSLRHGGSEIPYRVRRSARRKKTMQISVDDKGVLVAAPSAVPDAEIRAFVRRKADWILDTLARMKPAAEPSRSANGESQPRESIRHRGEDIPYRVRRSARRKKTMQISVDDKGVLVAAPTAVPDGEIRDFIRRKADWILESLARMRDVAESSRLVNGNSLPYRGAPVRLNIQTVEARDADKGKRSIIAPTVDGGSLRIEFGDADINVDAEIAAARGFHVEVDGGVRVDYDERGGSPIFRIAVPESLPDDERDDAIRRELAGWYWERAEELIGESVRRWLPKFGYGREPTVIVRDQKRRWGSCSSDGVLRFNWRLAMLHPDLLDYVVVHELSHLEVMNHSPKFWAVVEKRLPNARDLRRRIKDEGGKLPF